jgi:hypothetical protein
LFSESVREPAVVFSHQVSDRKLQDIFPLLQRVARMRWPPPAAIRKEYLISTVFSASGPTDGAPFEPAVLAWPAILPQGSRAGPSSRARRGQAELLHAPIQSVNNGPAPSERSRTEFAKIFAARLTLDQASRSEISLKTLIWPPPLDRSSICTSVAITQVQLLF